MSSATVSSLSTAGPAPARTADRTAAVVDSARATGMVTRVPRAADKAVVSTLAGPGPFLPADDAGGGEFVRPERAHGAGPHG